MTGLLEGWEADYDGKRWFYRYKATGLVQYHFPQPGDEYAEFLFDAGTGPLQLTPEERLAIEQQSKRRSVPGSDSDTGNSTRTSGSRREKKKVEAIEEGGGMSATGYFDPSSFMYPPGAYNNISPVEDEDGDENTFGKKRSQDTPNTALGITPEATPTENLHTSHLGVAGHGVQRTNKLTGNAHQQAVELPEGGQQIWSPVGYVAELATQDTVKCAEELAPVELDATSSILVPIRTNTNIAQGLAELPTHKTPVEETAPDMPLIQPVVQSVDAYPLVSASFAYPPLKTNINPVVNASSGIVSTGETVSPGKNAVAIGESKYQPFKPTSNTIEQTLQEHNNTTESLPQTSVLQNQNNELGHLGQNNSGHAELSMAGDIPSTLAPPLAQSKPAPTKTSSSVDSQTPSIPSALQPAQKPAKQSASLEITNQLPQAGVQANSVSVPGHNLPHHSSMLTPGGTKPNNHFPESEGNLKFRPPQLSAQNTPGNVNSSRPSEQIMHASSSHIGHPSVPRINTPPDKVASGSSSPPKPNSGPGFLLFHEITSTPNASDYGTSVHPGESAKPAVTPHNPNSGHIHSQPSISANQGGPVVAPLNLHSSASSWVSSINPQKQDSKPDLGKPALIPSDKMSEVHSGTGSFMPQLTPPPSSQTSKPPNHQILAESNKPSHTAMGGGVNGLAATSASARPQSIYQLSSSPATGLQQGPAQTTLAMANMFKPGLVMVNPATQPNTTSSPSNVGTTTTQSQPYMQATHRPPLPVQGLSNHSQKPPQLLPFQTGNPGQVTPSPGPPNPQGNVSSTPIPQTPAAIASGRPPAQVTQAHSHAAHQPAAQNNPVQNVNNTSQQQASMPIPNMTGPVPLPTTQSAHPSYHQPYGQGNAPQSQFRPPTVGSQQAPTHNPNIQRPPTAGLPSQQPPAQPSAGYQALGSPTGQIPPKPPNQQPSPATQSVSPIQSQVSSPAQSIASLHISQASTPSNTFATVNSPTSAHGGSNTNTNQYTNGPVRPSSASAYTSAQQGGNIKPNHSHPMSQQPAGAVHNQSPSTINSPPPKPFPMLPGQVTPLPSQLGSAPVPSPLQQSVLNSPAKPAFNAQQTTPGQQPTQTVAGGLAQNSATPGQVNPMLYSPQGTVPYGTQMRPPQQQNPSIPLGANHGAGHQQPTGNQPQPQPQQTASYPLPSATGQPQQPHMAMPTAAGSLPATGQYTFAPPPVAQAQQPAQNPGVVTSPVAGAPGKPFTSTQAATALTDAGKGMKKWAMKMLKNPAIKQTAAGIGGAVMAESMGVNAVAGAQLASNFYASTNRPPMVHAQTAPPQAHGVPTGAPQHQPVQMGQQYQPGKPQPLQPQPNHQLSGHPQPVQPQPGRPPLAHPMPVQSQPGHPQPGHPQPGHPQPGQHPQPGHPQPGHPQAGHPQAGHPQPANPQLVHNPAGAQPFSRPPVVQNPAMTAGVAVNLNAQAQAQVGFNQQQQQYPLVRPVMVPGPGPPMPMNAAAFNAQIQAQAQARADANTAAAATLIGSAVGAAMRPGNSQPSNAHGSAQEHTQSGHAPYGAENHGYHNENQATAHEQMYGESIPPPPPLPPPPPGPYPDNSYMAADATYVDNSSYAVSNNFGGNTEVVNNTIYVDNSAAFADTTYGSAGYGDAAAFGGAGYADASAYGGADVTVNVNVNNDISSTVYTDESATAFGMESINVASTSDFSVLADYSGSGWGDFSF